MSRQAWHTKEDVLRDLTEVVGVSVTDVDENYIVTGERPPPCRPDDGVDDEMTLLFGNDYKSANDEKLSPDIDGIKRMLQMVDNEGIQDHDTDMAQASKLATESPTLRKKRNKKNIAIESLLEMQELNATRDLKLLTPNDFIMDYCKKTTSGMFTKKQSSPQASPVAVNNTSHHQRSPPAAASKAYVPSTLAAQYYEEFKQRSEQDAIRENIWEHLEKRLKEIDRKRSQEAVSSPQPAVSSPQTDDDIPACIRLDAGTTKWQNLDKVLLPQHRHKLTGECVVCQVLVVKQQVTVSQPPTTLDELSDAEKR